MFTVPHTAHRTLILLVSMYMLLGYCQVRSFNTVYYIVQCHSNFNLLCCKTGRRGSSVLAAKTHSQSNHRHFTDIEHATGTKSSWVRAVWRLTSVTAETELTNGDSRNINNYKKKIKSTFPHLNNLLLLYLKTCLLFFYKNRVYNCPANWSD